MAAATPSTLPFRKGQVLPIPRRLERDRGRNASRECLHRLRQPLYARAATRRGNRCSCMAGTSGIGTDRDHVRDRAGRNGDRNGRDARKVRGLHRARCAHMRSTIARPISSPRSSVITQDRGVDVVLDIVGGDYVARDLAAPGARRQNRLHRYSARSPRRARSRAAPCEARRDSRLESCVRAAAEEKAAIARATRDAHLAAASQARGDRAG